MNLEMLSALLYYRKMNQSELSRRSGITRQAVSKWFTAQKFNPEGNTLLKLSETLQVDARVLACDLFSDLGSGEKQDLETLVLWDRLYGSLEYFVAALARFELKAIARYIQVFGILKAEKIFGKRVFQKFDRFAPFIHPVRRKELKALCQTFQELNLI